MSGQTFDTPQGKIVWNLISEAILVRENAYAPYSNYLVGAAIWTKRNHVYVGCNMEAADYDGTHAEEAALAAMVAAGERHPQIILVMGGLRDAKELSNEPPLARQASVLMFLNIVDNQVTRILANRGDFLFLNVLTFLRT